MTPLKLTVTRLPISFCSSTESNKSLWDVDTGTILFCVRALAKSPAPPLGAELERCADLNENNPMVSGRAMAAGKKKQLLAPYMFIAEFFVDADALCRITAKSTAYPFNNSDQNGCVCSFQTPDMINRFDLVEYHSTFL